MKHLREIEDLLTSLGAPWHLELGTHHWKIMRGPQLVGILPRGRAKDGDGRARKNILGQIKRAQRAAEASA